MENVRKFLPLFVGAIVAFIVFFLSRSLRQSRENNSQRLEILAKAREAKLAKSILSKSENEDSENTPNP